MAEKSSYATYLVEGLNTEKNLNFLCGNGICLYEVKKINKKQYFVTVPFKERKKLIALLKNRCYNIKLIKSGGFLGFLEKIKTRFVLAALVFAAFCGLFVASRFVWDIEVNGDADAAAVLAVLEEKGIKKGCPLSRINIDETENFLSSRIESSMYCLLDVEGCRLYVTVIERESAPPVVDLNQPVDLVSEYDGVLTRLLTVSGTPAVNVGDRISKGQVIISGVRTYNDGTTAPVRAMGEAWATVECTGEAVFSETKTVLEETGDFYYTTYIGLWGYDSIPKEKKKYEFSKFEDEVFRLFPLGIRVVRRRVAELKERTVSASIEESLPALREEALRNALKNAPFKQYDRVEYVTFKRDNNTVVRAIIYGDVNIIGLNEGDKEFGKKDGEN